jgi:hypothetical protein
VINEESRQIENSGEPENHEHDVRGLNPEHVQAAGTGRDSNRNIEIDRCNM